MQVSGKSGANVLIHFWRAGVHVRRLVVPSEGQYLPCAVTMDGFPAGIPRGCARSGFRRGDENMAEADGQRLSKGSFCINERAVADANAFCWK